MAGEDDEILCIVGLELLRQGAKTELAADFGGLEAVPVVSELESVDFALLVLHALDRDTASAQLIEEHGMPRQTFPAVFVQ